MENAVHSHGGREHGDVLNLGWQLESQRKQYRIALARRQEEQTQTTGLFPNKGNWHM